MGSKYFSIDRKTAEKIVNTSYYHLKHYGELNEYLTHDANYYVAQMRQSKEEAQGLLGALISEQENRDLSLLNRIFSYPIPIAANANTSQIDFANIYNQGCRASSVEEKVECLNKLLKTTIRQESLDVNKALNNAMEVINSAFNEVSATNLSFSTLEEERHFISALISIREKLSTEINKNSLLRETLQRSLSALNSAINYYISDYERKNREMGSFESGISSALKSIQEVFIVKNADKMEKKRQHSNSFSSVKASMKSSMRGFLEQKSGADYETQVAESLLQDFRKVFSNAKVTITNSGSKVVGLKADSFKRQQKSDIELMFTLSDGGESFSSFTITFSVKKTGKNSSIRVHHGGSLFSYAKRFSSAAAHMGAGDVFDFLNEGNFLYIYANELKDGSFTDNLRDMLMGAGFFFLGQEVKGLSGADFLFVEGSMMVAFSTILKRIQIRPDDFLKVTVERKMKTPVSEKAALVSSYYDSSWYSDKFIQKSAMIGKKAIYGTSFSINLLKSAFN